MRHPSGTCAYCGAPHRLYLDPQSAEVAAGLVYRHLTDGERCPGSGRPALESADGAWLVDA